MSILPQQKETLRCKLSSENPACGRERQKQCSFNKRALFYLTVAAPWLGLLGNDVWLNNARHANAMARHLADRITGVPGVTLLFKPEVNAVFAQLPPPVQVALRARGWRFYTFIGEGGCRFMCAWDTPKSLVDQFADDIITLAAAT